MKNSEHTSIEIEPDRAVNEKLRADANETETDLTGGTFIPPSTFRCHANKEKLGGGQLQV